MTIRVPVERGSEIFKFCDPSRARRRFRGGPIFTPLKKVCFSRERGRKSQNSHSHAAWEAHLSFPCSVGVPFSTFSADVAY